MTTVDLHSSEPPSWAQEILTWLVPASNEENTPGDLIEEYRDTVRPSLGQWRANLWYVGQVAGFLSRLAWMFIALNAAAVILRTIVDTFAPPGIGPNSFLVRAHWSGYAGLSTFILAGGYAGYRLGHVRASGITAMAASAAGFAIALGFTVVLFYTVIQHDPAKLNSFYVTGGWVETIGMPVVITVIAAPLGLLGGFFGVSARRLTDRRVAT